MANLGLKDNFLNSTLIFAYIVNMQLQLLKFVYSEKATKFCEIFPLLLSTVHTDKSKVEISQNFVAFSEYMNFITKTWSLVQVCESPQNAGPSSGTVSQSLQQKNIVVSRSC